MTVSNAGMRHPLPVQRKIIVIVGHEHAAGAMRKRQMLLIRSAKETGLRSERDINAAPPQSVRNGGIDVFIQVEAYRLWRHGQRVSR